jgi:SSS family solute:Na+ symporter
MPAWQIATGAIAVYLVVTLFIGQIANRYLRVDLEDFLLYGRRAGFVVLYLTVVATYHSAFAFLGSSGFFYTHGIGFWDAGVWTVLVGFATMTIGVRIWSLGKERGYITPADLLADAYRSEAVRLVAALVSVLFTILYIQVQSQGLGYILTTASGGRIPYPLAVAVLLGVAAIYLMAGGLRAVYWTDVLQGVWMYVAVWAGALVLAWKLFGGPLELWREVAVQRPDLLTLPGPRGFFTYPMWFSLGVVLSFGIVLQPHLFIRYYTAINARTLRWLGATTPIYLMSLYIPTALIGLGGALVLPDLEVADRVFPELLLRYAPGWLTGLILAGGAAAAMSTLDSILHANMTVLTRDIYQRILRPNASQAHYVFVGRLLVVGLLVVGYFLSVTRLEFLVVLVSLSGAGALQLWPAVMGALYPTRFRYSSGGVLAGIAAGLVTLVATLILWKHPFGFHGGLWGVVVNFAVTGIVSMATAARSTQERGSMKK